MSELASRISGLSADKRALLEQQLLKRHAAGPAVEGIRPRRPGERFPLSFAQQRLWFLDQMTPDTSAYSATLTFRLDGRLDRDALHLAFNSIVERHEALRTVVDDVGGLPEPRVLQGVTVDLRFVDFIKEGIDVSSEIVEAILREETSRPFDLSRDVMLRPTLVRVAEECHVLHMVLHHIACDGWSRSVLFDELSILYNASVAGERSPLVDLPVQYGDYALWQEQWLRGEVLARELEWWRQELAGANTVLDMPTDHPRPEVQSFKGARLQFSLPVEVSAGVKDLGRQERTTTFMTILAALGTLLFFESGQDDILIGSPIANRHHSEIEGLIGFFVNTLLLRVKMQGDPTMRELLARARENAIGAYAHQDVPFEKLVEALRPRRHAGRNPLFQVNYRMQGPPPAPPQLTGLNAARLGFDFGAARFDLALGVMDAPDRLHAYIEYNAALFERATAARIAASLSNLLEEAVRSPDRRLSELRNFCEPAKERTLQPLDSAYGRNQ